MKKVTETLMKVWTHPSNVSTQSKLEFVNRSEQKHEGYVPKSIVVVNEGESFVIEEQLFEDEGKKTDLIKLLWNWKKIEIESSRICENEGVNVKSWFECKWI